VRAISSEGGVDLAGVTPDACRPMAGGPLPFAKDRLSCVLVYAASIHQHSGLQHAMVLGIDAIDAFYCDCEHPVVETFDPALALRYQR